MKSTTATESMIRADRMPMPGECLLRLSKALSDVEVSEVSKWVEFREPEVCELGVFYDVQDYFVMQWKNAKEIESCSWLFH